jgi:macrolide transport system ATP-binding/permease protein
MRLFRFFSHKSDLAEEIETHLKMATADRIERGESPRHARASAIREFGNVPLVAEATSEQWGWLRLELLMNDIHYALRQLRKTPGFTLTAVIMIALGIGANTAIFTLVHGILLSSLPVNDPSRLYRIGDKDDCCYFNNFQNENGDVDLFSWDLFIHFKQSAPEFEQLAAVQVGGGYIARVGSAPGQPMRTEFVSGNYFTTLGIGAFAAASSTRTTTSSALLQLSFSVTSPGLLTSRLIPTSSAPQFKSSSIPSS